MLKDLSTLVVASTLTLGSLATPASALTDEQKQKLLGATLAIGIAKAVRERQEERYGRGYIARRLSTGYVYCYPEVEQCFFKGRPARNTTIKEFGHP